MTYVLHYAPDNASMIIRLALEHLEVPFDTALVDRAAQGQNAPAYLALNPNGLIPVLETPQGAMFETGAILLWLGDTHGRLGPMPDDAGRAEYLKWLFFVANTLHPALRMLFYPEKYVGTDASAQAQLRTGLQATLHRAFGTVDAVAADLPAGFGGVLPAALMFYLAGCLRWCALYPADHSRAWFDLAAYPALAQVCAGLEALPCTRALQAAEGLGDTPFTKPTYANPPFGSAT